MVRTVLEMGNTVVATNQVTASSQGGWVREPWYL